MATAIQRIEQPGIAPLPGFSLASLKVFRSIPAYHHGIVALRGAVIVYETDTLYREGVQDGSFYVVESQYPVANMAWESWLRAECEDEHRHRRAQPRNPRKSAAKSFRPYVAPAAKIVGGIACRAASPMDPSRAGVLAITSWGRLSASTAPKDWRREPRATAP